MKNWIFKNKLVLMGALLGAIGGYCYYHFVGCTSGTCMITSKPVNSTLYFGFMGALFFSILKKNSDGDRK
jgi:phage shock protein E